MDLLSKAIDIGFGLVLGWAMYTSVASLRTIAKSIKSIAEDVKASTMRRP